MQNRTRHFISISRYNVKGVKMKFKIIKWNNKKGKEKQDIGINHYHLYESQKDTKIVHKVIPKREMFYILHNFIKRNLKWKTLQDVELWLDFNDYSPKGKIKKQIKHYALTEILELIFNKAKKHKTGSTPIHKAMVNFIEYLKEQDKQYNLLNNKQKHYVYNFPKPKYQRGEWRAWYNLKEYIKLLKRRARKTKNKQIYKSIKYYKKQKELLGQYLSLKETKSKKLDKFYQDHKTEIDNIIEKFINFSF